MTGFFITDVLKGWTDEVEGDTSLQGVETSGVEALESNGDLLIGENFGIDQNDSPVVDASDQIDEPLFDEESDHVPAQAVPDDVTTLDEDISLQQVVTQESIVEELTKQAVEVHEKPLLDGALNDGQESLINDAKQATIKLADVEIEGKNKGELLPLDQALETLIALTATENDLKRLAFKTVIGLNTQGISEDLLSNEEIAGEIKDKAEKGIFESYSQKVQETVADADFQDQVIDNLEHDPDVAPLLDQLMTPEVQNDMVEGIVQNVLDPEKENHDIEGAVQGVIENNYHSIVLKEVLTEKLVSKPSTQQILFDTLGQSSTSTEVQPVSDLITVKVIGPEGALDIPLENVHFAVGSLDLVIDPIREFVPGRYQAEVQVTNPITEESQIITQDFLWGVLAVNTDKDIYKPGEQAKVAIGVLDDEGKPVCDAQVTLTVTATDGSVVTPPVTNTENCQNMDSKNVLPDYQAIVDFTTAGAYQMEVVSTLNDGRTRSTLSTINVQPLPDFAVERQAATRLYPVGWAPMTVKLYFNKDFKGDVTDVLPSDFQVDQVNGQEKAFDLVTDANHNEKKLTWKINAKAGEVITLDYLYDAPDVSPEFYTIGPLTSDAFTEARVWQIANDEPVITADSTSNLRLHWKFNSGTGTTATDSSSNALNGTLTNMESVDWVTDTPSLSNANTYSLDFDGVNEYVTRADNSLLDFADTDDFTLTGWFYRDTATTDDTIIAKSNGQLASNTGYILYIDDATDKLILNLADGVDLYTLTSSTTLASTGWNHFAVVWDQDSAANSEIYINGVADSATDTGTIGNIGSIANAVPFRAGAESDGGNPFDGKLDDIRVYSRVLTTSEISVLASGNRPGNVSDIALWLKADAGVTTSGQDVSAWQDQAGLGYDFIQGTTGNQPDYTSNALNSHPVITFDGVDDHLMTTTFEEPLTVFGVIKNTDTGQNDRIFFGVQSDVYTYFTAQKANNSSGNSVSSYYLDGSEFNVSTTNIDNQYFLHEGGLTISRSGDVNLAINGESIGVTTTTGTSPGFLGAAVGAGYNNSSLTSYFQGDIAELVIYYLDLSATDRQKIESYLALKYGLTLDQSATGGGLAYLNSAGTTIWSADATDTFEYDIGGMAQDDTSALDQLKSKSINSDAILTVGDATSQDDLDSLMWANNNGAATWTSTGAPANYSILSRRWQAEEINDIGTVDLEFDVADADFDVPALQGGTGYYFIYDSDDDGSLSDETPVLMSDSGSSGDDTASDNKWTVQHNFSHIVDNKIDFTIATFVTPPPTVTDANISVTSGGSGTGGAYIVGDQVIVSWNNTAGGDNNTGLTSVTADLSGWGGSATATMTDTTDCFGIAGNNIYEACYTLTEGTIDATNVGTSVTATNVGGQTATADSSTSIVDNQPPTVTVSAISVTGATGTGGDFKFGDSATGRWDNSATGDNNADTISSVSFDLSDFRSGDANRTGTSSSDIWTASLSGTLDSQGDTNNNVTVTVTDNAGNQTTLAGTNNYTVDTNLPSITSIVSVAGDTGAPYYDLTNDSSTAISFNSTDIGTGVSACRWDTSNVSYSTMSNACAGGTSCTTNLSGEGVKTIYLSCIDGAGNVTSSNTQVDYTVDTASPTGTSMTPSSTRIINNDYPAFVVSDGTDAVSGIDTGSRTLERSEATYSSNTCGSFGGFTSVTYTGTYPNITDNTASGSKCYQYRWSVSDNAGNSSSATTSTIVRAPLTTLVITGGDGQSYGDSTHNPIGYTLATPLQVQVTDGGTNTGQSGEVTVDFTIIAVPGSPAATGQSLSAPSAATDASGIAQVSFTFGDRAGNYQIQASSVDAAIGNTTTFTITAGDYSDLVAMETDILLEADPFSMPTISASPVVSLTTNAASYELHLTPDNWLTSGVNQILNWTDPLGFGWSFNAGVVTAFEELLGNPDHTTVYSCAGDTCQGAQILDVDLHVAIDYMKRGGVYTNNVDFSIENLAY